MANTYDFIINTEDVNRYGFRVLSDGLDYTNYMKNPVVLFGHKRAMDSPNKIIGKCTGIKKEDTKLIASIEFDTDNFSQEVEGKVSRGMLRMASIGADPLETSSAPEFILSGQTSETVTKSELFEISIVDIGGNQNALRLSKDGQEFQLPKIQIKQNYSMKTIALALGMSADTDEASVLGKVTALKLAKENAENALSALQAKMDAQVKLGAEKLIDEAVTLGLIPESLKAVQLAAFIADPEAQEPVLVQLIADKKKETGDAAAHSKVKGIVLGADAKKGGKTNPKQTFDYLQKHNHVELMRIRDEEPERFKQIQLEYNEGVRYTPETNA